jgi:hypothetical protein
MRADNLLRRHLWMVTIVVVVACSGLAASATSMDKALEIYTRFREANHVTISVTRRGKPMTLDYTIR